MISLTDRQLKNFFDKVDIPLDPDGCHEWTGATNSAGYGTVRLNGNTYLTHRIAFMLEHGHEPKDCVLHSCDNPRCVNTDHLRDGSKSDNSVDKAQRGPIRGNKKLTPEDIEKIRHLLFLGCYTQIEIARRFGTVQTAISKINTGENWNHV